MTTGLGVNVSRTGDSTYPVTAAKAGEWLPPFSHADPTCAQPLPASPHTALRRAPGRTTPMATLTATRTATSLTDAELVASARRRLGPLIERYGAESPQVVRALERWSKLERARTADDDLTALLDTLGLPR